MFDIIYRNLDRQTRGLALLHKLLREEYELLCERKTDDVITLELSIHELLRQLAEIAGRRVELPRAGRRLLARLPDVAQRAHHLLDAELLLVGAGDDLLEGLNEGRKQPDDLWRSCKRFVEKTADRNGRTVWVRNYAALQDACRCAGIFVLRTNEEEDPFRALWAYRLRGRVELDFNQFKNQVDGDRLRSTQTGYLGKLFVCTLAAAIRLMMLKRAHDSREPGVSLPHNSIDCLLAKLRCLKADKRLNGNAWVMRTITKKQRDYLSLLLSVPLPPKVLR